MWATADKDGWQELWKRKPSYDNKLHRWGNAPLIGAMPSDEYISDLFYENSPIEVELKIK